MKSLAYILILIPILLIALRVVTDDEPDQGVLSDLSYSITYHHEISGAQNYYSAESFLPVDDFRQSISVDPELIADSEVTQSDRHSNRKIVWQGSAATDTTLMFRYSAKTRHVEYNLHEELTHDGLRMPAGNRYLASTATIQSGHPAILQASAGFKASSPVKVSQLAADIFDYVADIPSVEGGSGRDALGCHEKELCSEEGKSRLLTALFRSAGIPARVAGGLVLRDGKKGSLDYWMQAYIGDQWVTFDPERGHFADLPATHLELFRGDSAFDNVTAAIGTESFYEISKERRNDYTEYAVFNIWNLIDGGELPLRPVTVLLLLPLGAYIVAICTNVVGFKTYGVFLPVLIAFAFIEMGMIQGIIFFTVIIGLISLMSFPLERWGILHVPKIVCLLTAVGIYCLAAVKLFYITGWVAPSATLTFPVIILTLIAERFAQKVEEESLSDALFIYGQTLIVTLSCYWILSASVIQHFFITFPEVLIGIAGLSLLLGKWIGLQLFEYSRFSKIDQEISYVK